MTNVLKVINAKEERHAYILLLDHSDFTKGEKRVLNLYFFFFFFTTYSDKRQLLSRRNLPPMK